LTHTQIDELVDLHKDSQKDEVYIHFKIDCIIYVDVYIFVV